MGVSTRAQHVFSYFGGWQVIGSWFSVYDEGLRLQPILCGASALPMTLSSMNFSSSSDSASAEVSNRILASKLSIKAHEEDEDDVTVAMERAMKCNSDPDHSFIAMFSFEPAVNNAFETWRMELRRTTVLYLPLLPLIYAAASVCNSYREADVTLFLNVWQLRTILASIAIILLSAKLDDAYFNAGLHFMSGLGLAFRIASSLAMEPIFFDKIHTEDSVFYAAAAHFVMVPILYKVSMDPPMMWCFAFHVGPVLGYLYSNRTLSAFLLQPEIYCSILGTYGVLLVMERNRRLAFISQLKVRSLEHKVAKLQFGLKDAQINQQRLDEYRELEAQVARALGSATTAAAPRGYV